MTTLAVASLLSEAARWRPDKIAVVDGAVRTSYADLWSQALGVAGALADLGVEPGDAVALMCPNVTDFPRCYYGIMAAGGVVVPVHLLLTADEVGYVLTDSKAKVLLCHSSQLQVGARAAAAAGIPVVSTGPLPAEVAADFRRLEDLSAATTAPRTFVSRQAEDPSVVLYTSGTTGKSKGAVLTQLNLVMNATVGVFDTLDTRPEDVGLACLPLFHTFGQTVSMNCSFRVGATMVMLPRFAGDAAIDLMLAEDVTIFHGVPTMYIGLLAAAEGRTELPDVADVRVRWRVVADPGAAPVRGGVRHPHLRGLRAFRDLAVGDHQPAALRHQAGHRRASDLGRRGGDRPTRGDRGHRIRAGR